MTTSITTAQRLENIGFGPSRSRALAAERPTFAQLAIAFADACQAKGTPFRVFQASGHNGYYARLRLKVVTGKEDNAYNDTRGFKGPMVELEVGSRSTTKGQVAALTNAIRSLANAADIGIAAA